MLAPLLVGALTDGQVSTWNMFLGTLIPYLVERGGGGGSEWPGPLG